jgi:hypothetical protein
MFFILPGVMVTHVSKDTKVNISICTFYCIQIMSIKKRQLQSGWENCVSIWSLQDTSVFSQNITSTEHFHTKS